MGVLEPVMREEVTVTKVSQKAPCFQAGDEWPLTTNRQCALLPPRTIVLASSRPESGAGRKQERKRTNESGTILVPKRAVLHARVCRPKSLVDLAQEPTAGQEACKPIQNPLDASRG